MGRVIRGPLATSLALGSALALTGCGQDAVGDVEIDALGADDDALVEVVQPDGVYVYQPVEQFDGVDTSVTGTVSELFGTEAFTVVGPGQMVLVVGADLADVTIGDYIQAWGTLRELDAQNLEEELRGDLDDDLYERFEGEPVLFAEDVMQPVPPPEIGDLLQPLPPMEPGEEVEH